MTIPEITPEQVKTLQDVKYLKLYDIEYAAGRHYYAASRRSPDELTALQSEDAVKKRGADAVSIFVILTAAGKEPRLLLTYEYRYPVGGFLLSIPAGLVDPEDRLSRTPLLTAAAREIREETGLTVGPEDDLYVVNPLLFSSPGITDESNALIAAVLKEPDLSALSQAGAVGGECFDGFCPVTLSEAQALLARGLDDRGHFLPIFTFCALQYFVSGAWKRSSGASVPSK